MFISLTKKVFSKPVETLEEIQDVTGIELTDEVVSVDFWTLTWCFPKAGYLDYYLGQNTKVFLSEKDALLFKTKLIEAMDLLNCIYLAKYITIVKNN